MHCVAHSHKAGGGQLLDLRIVVVSVLILVLVLVGSQETVTNATDIADAP